MAEDNELENAAKPTGKGTKYVCRTKCFYNGVLFYEGDVYTASPNEKVPEHFVKQ